MKLGKIYKNLLKLIVFQELIKLILKIKQLIKINLIIKIKLIIIEFKNYNLSFYLYKEYLMAVKVQHF